MKNHLKTDAYFISLSLVAALAFYASHAIAQPHEPVLALAKKEQAAVLQTMKELVEIESGSRSRSTMTARRIWESQTIDCRRLALAGHVDGDEEIGSPASRNLITRLGAEYDAILSYESGGGRHSC